MIFEDNMGVLFIAVKIINSSPIIILPFLHKIKEPRNSRFSIILSQTCSEIYKILPFFHSKELQQNDIHPYVNNQIV